MSSEDRKLVFQLTQQDDLLEVRLTAPGGESRVETQPPATTIHAQMAALDTTGFAESSLSGIGQTLYDCLLSGAAAELVTETLRDTREPGTAVHFELRFDPDQAALAQFPWETIADPAGHFLVRDGVVALTRYITYPQPPAPFDAALDRLPLLRVIAQPSGLPAIAAGDLGLVPVETLEHATFESLQQKLLIQRLAAWGMHFDGHGGMMLRCRKCKSLELPGTPVCSQCTTTLSHAPALGVLLFERNGGYDLITTEELGSVLYNAGIRFALLSACESANVAGPSLFNGLAPGLITAGVPAVIGMQYRISDDFASRFAASFYSALMQQKDIVAALTVARAMLLRSAWYSPALYLRQHRAADERLPSMYEIRSLDTAAPAEAQVKAPFLVRLWIRRPETQPLTEEQLRAELGVPDRIAISTRTGEADIKFEPIPDRKLRRGEVIIRLTSPTCEIVPPSVKLFVDEHVDAPPAIFTVKAIQPGPAALVFSVWQDGGQIASISHRVQAMGAGQRPRLDISARTHAMPVQTPAPPWGIPQPTEPGAQPMPPSSGGKPVISSPPITATIVTMKPLIGAAIPAEQPRHELRRWLGLVAMLWIAIGLAAPLPLTFRVAHSPEINPAHSTAVAVLMTATTAAPVHQVTATPMAPHPVATPIVEPPPSFIARDALSFLCWPTLALVLVALQLTVAKLYWRRRSPGIGRWLPATLLVGFVGLLAGLAIAAAIFSLLR